MKSCFCKLYCKVRAHITWYFGGTAKANETVKINARVCTLKRTFKVKRRRRKHWLFEKPIQPLHARTPIYMKREQRVQSVWGENHHRWTELRKIPGAIVVSGATVATAGEDSANESRSLERGRFSKLLNSLLTLTGFSTSNTCRVYDTAIPRRMVRGMYAAYFLRDHFQKVLF